MAVPKGDYMAKGDKRHSTKSIWQTDIAFIHNELKNPENYGGLQRKAFTDVDHPVGKRFEKLYGRAMAERTFNRCISALLKMRLVEKGETTGPETRYFYRHNQSTRRDLSFHYEKVFTEAMKLVATTEFFSSSSTERLFRLPTFTLDDWIVYLSDEEEPTSDETNDLHLGNLYEKRPSRDLMLYEIIMNPDGFSPGCYNENGNSKKHRKSIIHFFSDHLKKGYPELFDNPGLSSPSFDVLLEEYGELLIDFSEEIISYIQGRFTYDENEELVSYYNGYLNSDWTGYSSVDEIIYRVSEAALAATTKYSEFHIARLEKNIENHLEYSKVVFEPERKIIISNIDAKREKSESLYLDLIGVLFLRTSSKDIARKVVEYSYNYSARLDHIIQKVGLKMGALKDFASQVESIGQRVTLGEPLKGFCDFCYRLLQ